MFNTSNLSDFISACPMLLPAGITTWEASALTSDAVPTFTAAIAMRVIKQIRASQTVLINYNLLRRRSGRSGTYRVTTACTNKKSARNLTQLKSVIE